MRITKVEYAQACGIVQGAGLYDGEVERTICRRAVYKAFCDFFEDGTIEGGRYFDSETFARDIGGEDLR